MFDTSGSGKGWRGREKTRWKDSCKRHVESVGSKEEDVLGRTRWKYDVQNHSGDPRWLEKPDEKKKQKKL